MKTFQSSLTDPSELDSTVWFLENTTVYIDIFSNANSMVHSVNDPRIQKLLDVLTFFHNWEDSCRDPKEISKHLISHQPREDIDSSVYGFIEMVNVASSLHIWNTTRLLQL